MNQERDSLSGKRKREMGKGEMKMPLAAGARSEGRSWCQKRLNQSLENLPGMVVPKFSIGITLVCLG